MKIIETNVMLVVGQFLITVFDQTLHSVNELTSLLHRSYKEMADNGMYFLAANQSVEKTLERLEGGICLVVLKDGKLIGTICYYSSAHESVNTCFTRFDVGHFGQFAVDPEFQKIGLGRKLICIVEEIAVKDEKRYLALDTAEKAGNLVSYYKRLGFEHVEYMQWGHYNYRSVVMSKELKTSE